MSIDKKLGSWIIGLGLAAALLIGCSSDNYSETTPDGAKAAREKIKGAEANPPVAPK